MKLVVVVFAFAAFLAFAPAASAHRLSVHTAHGETEERAGEVFETIDNDDRFAFDYFAEDCRRLSSHSIRCTGGVLILDWKQHASIECSWLTTVRFRSSRSRRLRVSEGTSTCRPLRRSPWNSAARIESEFRAAR